jgi:hypothetical protein
MRRKNNKRSIKIAVEEFLLEREFAMIFSLRLNPQTPVEKVNENILSEAMKLDFMLGFWFMLVESAAFENDVNFLEDSLQITSWPSLLNASQAKALSCYFVREFIVPLRAERNSSSIYNENIFLLSSFLSLGNAAHTQIYCIISHAPLCWK